MQINAPTSALPVYERCLLGNAARGFKPPTKFAAATPDSITRLSYTLLSYELVASALHDFSALGCLVLRP